MAVEEQPATKEEPEVEGPPALGSSPSGENDCPVEGCGYTGKGEARIAHWRGSHLPEVLLWFCPMGPDAEALQNHLAGKRHKLHDRTVASLMTLPPHWWSWCPACDTRRQGTSQLWLTSKHYRRAPSLSLTRGSWGPRLQASSATRTGGKLFSEHPPPQSALQLVDHCEPARCHHTLLVSPVTTTTPADWGEDSRISTTGTTCHRQASALLRRWGSAPFHRPAAATFC